MIKFRKSSRRAGRTYKCVVLLQKKLAKRIDNLGRLYIVCYIVLCFAALKKKIYI